MTIDLIYLYHSIFKAQGVNYLLFDDSFSNIENIDYGFRKNILKHYNYTDFKSYILELVQSDSVAFVHDMFQLDYCVLQFPSRLQKDYHAKYLVIGPVMCQPISTQEIKKLFVQFQLPPEFMQDTLEFYNRIPHFSSFDFWISLIRPLLTELFPESIEYKFTKYNYEVNEKYDYSEFSPNVSVEALESRYYVEEQLMNAIISGNKELALEWHRKFLQFKLVPRTSDTIRNQKNKLLTFNTLLRVALGNANIHPYYIDKISSEFAIKIEACNTQQQLEHFAPTMIRKYCLFVHNYANRNHSKTIEHCIQYIDFHFAEPLSLSQLADYCSITTNYLSSLFRKETGKTITDYINETRINHSVLLLNTTKLSIQAIANQCGFTDSNYFTRIFKRLKGMTPHDYRKKIQV